MNFDAAQITKLARETGFPADNLEKVLRLRELLTELHKLRSSAKARSEGRTSHGCTYG
jgi:hypothetical protein